MGDRDSVRPGVLAGLVLSLLAFSLAPFLMPASYSWIAHTLSQAAAQGQEGGWLSRVGFLLAGLTILRLSSRDVVDWSPLARSIHRVTGTLVLAAIAFTDRSWDANAPYDRVENIIHSAVATSIAISFSLGVLVVLNEKRLRRGRWPLLESVIVTLQILLPPMMLVWVEGTGLIERAMFGAAYVWYGWEILRCSGYAFAKKPQRDRDGATRRLARFDLRRVLVSHHRT